MPQENQQNQNRPWYWFMNTNQWVVFMNIMRILTFIMLAVIIYVLITNIQEVKLLGSACEICMNKTGATCFLPPEV